MSIGKKGMLYAAECMALGCVRLVQEPKVLEQVWKEHEDSANCEPAGRDGMKVDS